MVKKMNETVNFLHLYVLKMKINNKNGFVFYK